MTHPLVDQLRFTRREFRRGLQGLNGDDAQRRLLPMNCISWNIGHLAWQEQRYCLWRAQNLLPFPDIQEQFAYGAPGSSPSLDTALAAWEAITAAADEWLDTLTTAKLQEFVTLGDQPSGVSFGNLIHRLIYHYWYHTGENMAIRQALGHTDLPEFVGDIDEEAPYRPEQ